MKTKLNIVHVIQALHSGGCENMLLRTLPRLKSAHHTIITLMEPGELAPQFEAAGIAVKNRDKGVNLVDMVTELQPDLIMTYLFHADVAGRLVLRRRNIAPVISFLRTTYNFPRYWPARLFEKLTRRWADHYFANSDAVKAYYVQHLGVDPDQITVIPNGIDMAVVTKTKEPSPPLPVSDASVVITCVANLAPNKGHRFLLDAFDAVAADHPEAVLLLVGEGEERQALEQQRDQLACKDRIHLLGRRNDVAAILAQTDIFVLPTLFEGMSNALLEAMAAKCACITTDIPENRAIVTDKKNGLLVPVQVTQELQTALHDLLSNHSLREQLGHAAQTFIEDNFALDAVIIQWEQAIHKHAKQGK